MQETLSLNEFVDLVEAGQLMKVHPKTVSGIISKGDIPAGKIGRKVVMRRVDVVKYTTNVIMAQTERRLSPTGNAPQPKRRRTQ